RRPRRRFARSSERNKTKSPGASPREKRPRSSTSTSERLRNRSGGGGGLGVTAVASPPRPLLRVRRLRPFAVRRGPRLRQPRLLVRAAHPHPGNLVNRAPRFLALAAPRVGASPNTSSTVRSVELCVDGIELT